MITVAQRSIKPLLESLITTEDGIYYVKSSTIAFRFKKAHDDVYAHIQSIAKTNGHSSYISNFGDHVTLIKRSHHHSRAYYVYLEENEYTWNFGRSKTLHYSIFSHDYNELMAFLKDYFSDYVIVKPTDRGYIPSEIIMVESC